MKEKIIKEAASVIFRTEKKFMEGKVNISKYRIIKKKPSETGNYTPRPKKVMPEKPVKAPKQDNPLDAILKGKAKKIKNQNIVESEDEGSGMDDDDDDMGYS